MPLNLHAMMVAHAQAFADGRFDDITGDVAYPYAMHLEDRLLVHATPAELRATLAAYRRLFALRGITAVTPHVERQELPRRGRFRAWLRWEHHGPDGTEPVGSRATLYLGPGPAGRLRVEMIEYTYLSVHGIKTFQPHAA